MTFTPSAPPFEPEEIQFLERKKCGQCNYETNTDTESAVLKICEQMNTMSQKIESLERNSLTNFPNLAPRPSKK